MPGQTAGHLRRCFTAESAEKNKIERKITAVDLDGFFLCALRGK
jgi:hypothetical protein